MFGSLFFYYYLCIIINKIFNMKTKITNKKLFEILTHINSVRSGRWSDVRKIVNLISSIEIKEKKWFEKYKQDNPERYPLDLSKIETWSTYDDECIDLIFSNENNKLICNVSIYDGDNFSGYRKVLRFTATLVLPNSFIKELENKILYGLDKLAEYSYEDYLENQKNLWVSNFKSEILGTSI